MALWLVDASMRDELRAAAAPSPDAVASYLFDEGSRDRELYTKAGGVAVIKVEGLLTKAPSLMALLVGGANTVYRDIARAVAQADTDPEVTEIVLRVDSPGGHLDGLFDALAAIQGAKKPTRCTVAGMACSAAYAIASQCGSIEATSKACRVGSIGVVVDVYTDDSVVSITSTNAPKKRPDVRTGEGVAMVREELDALHALFVDAIAEGRGVTPDEVDEKYGNGGVLLAEAALERGMIDAIINARSSGGTEESKMDLATLKAQHPEVYAAAVQDGVTQERDRVVAHVVMGEKAGAMPTACAAIKDGSRMTDTLIATYQSAAMDRRDIAANLADSQAAAAAADGTASADSGAAAPDFDGIFKLAADRCGVAL